MASVINEITSADLEGRGVPALPDVPIMPPEELKEKFEETVRGVVIPKVNEIVNHLNGLIIPEPEIPAGLTMTLLWENASPGSSFPATASLHVNDMSDFNFLYIVCRITATSNSAKYKLCVEFPKGIDKIGRCMYYSSSNGIMLHFYRDFEYLSDTTIRISAGSRIDQGSSSIQTVNDYLVPEAIYGSN